MGSRVTVFGSAFTLALAVATGAACVDEVVQVEPPPPSADAGADAAETEQPPRPLCVDGKPTSAYPPGPYDLEILGTVPPDATFAGPDGQVALSSFYEPCAARSRIVVVRSSASWCGPCLWHIAHTKRFLEAPKLAGRVVLVDLLVADEDNAPATLAAVPRWRAKIDTPASTVAIDPGYTFSRSQFPNAPLPGYVMIDTRTMQIVSTMTDPDPELVVARLELELAIADDTPRPPLLSPTLYDEHFTENEIDLVRGMALGDGAPPPDPTNEYADDPAAVLFGKELFSDALLSPSGTVSCATCHDPKLDLTDGARQSVGVATVDRNSPAIALSAHSRWQFWDGRADSLWSQALGPLEDAKELGASRVFVAQQIAARHATRYASVFGAKYPLPDMTSWPAAGKPGDAAYDALAGTEKEKASRVFVNVGKALAAFERAIRVEPNALDRYAAGDVTALTATQKHSLTVFLRNGCVQCHWGPRLTDDAFHVLRFPTGRQDGKADLGRDEGLTRLAASEFLGSSKWSDAPGAAMPFLVDVPSMLGAFKTPTLRGLPTSAPYGHGGMFTTLAEVSKHYGDRGISHSDPRAIGTTEKWVPNFDTSAVADLPAFLDVLTAHVVLP